MPTVDSLALTTGDGHRLAADISHPDGPALGGAVVCHPHPRFGGDRFNPVVDALFGELAERSFVTVRFDFRADHDDGDRERLDVIAALDELRARTDHPLVVAGYSFGAAVALSTDDARITAIAAVAPPLGAMEVATPSVPTLVLVPRHDQFCPPERARTETVGWPDVTVEDVESADHFLAGRAATVAGRAAEWLASRTHGSG